jgi:hypothetical protein
MGLNMTDVNESDMPLSDADVRLAFCQWALSNHSHSTSLRWGPNGTFHDSNLEKEFPIWRDAVAWVIQLEVPMANPLQAQAVENGRINAFDDGVKRSLEAFNRASSDVDKNAMKQVCSLIKSDFLRSILEQWIDDVTTPLNEDADTQGVGGLEESDIQRIIKEHSEDHTGNIRDPYEFALDLLAASKGKDHDLGN